MVPAAWGVNVVERTALKLVWKRTEKRMGSKLKRYLPLIGTAALAGAVVLRALGYAGAAQAIETVGGFIHVTDQSVVPAGELVAAIAAVTGVVLKIISEAKKARA